MVGVVTNVVTWRVVGERKTANSLRISGLGWCHQESNRGHKDFQSFALPTELWHLGCLGDWLLLSFSLLLCKVRDYFWFVQIFGDVFL